VYTGRHPWRLKTTRTKPAPTKGKCAVRANTWIPAMNFKAILAIAAACAVAVATSAFAAPQRAHEPNQFERAYDTMLDGVRLNYNAYIPDADWDKLQTKFGNKISNALELQRAVHLTLEAVGDKQLKLLTQTEVDKLESRTRSAIVGMGMFVTPVAFLNGALRITGVDTDSPAEAAGLRKNDLVVAVDGVAVHEMLYSDARALLRGKPGSEVKLSISRDGKGVIVPVRRDIDETLGIGIEPDGVFFGYRISSVHPEGPAAKAGLKQNDVIMRIDNKSTASYANQDEVDAALNQGRAGTTVKLTYMRDKQSAQVVVTRDYVLNSSLTVDFSGEMPSWKPGFWHIRMKHLDWADMPFSFRGIGGVLENDKVAVILDLRGASGSDPEVAAKIATWFVDQGIVMRYVEANSVITYTAKPGGTLERTSVGAVSSIEEIAPYEDHKMFSRQLIVLVDSNTKGTAEALAAMLQKSGRATVTGIASTGQPLVTSTVKVDYADDAAIVAQVPSRTFVQIDSSRITGVTPDKEVFWSDEIVNTAKTQVDGETWRVRNHWVAPIGAAIGSAFIILLVVVTTRLQARKERLEAEKAKNGSTTDVQTKVEKTEVPASKVETKADKVSAAKEEADTPTPRWQKLLMLGMLLTMFGMLFGARFFVDYMNSAPSGSKSSIEVTAYIDDSELSKLQLKVIEELASEYSGDIKFKIIDVEKTPELAVNRFGKVEHFPSINVKKTTVDATGKEIASSEGMSGPRTKRALVENLEMYAKTQTFWPDVDLTRTRKVTTVEVTLPE